MSKKLPKESLKKVSGGAASKNVISSKGGKKNVLDTDVSTSKASKKSNFKSETQLGGGC